LHEARTVTESSRAPDELAWGHSSQQVFPRDCARADAPAAFHVQMTAAPSALPTPPGPRARYPGEFLRAMARDPLAFLDGLRDRTATSRASGWPGRTMVLLSHPDAVREVLVTSSGASPAATGTARSSCCWGEGLLTSEGAFHLRQRRLAQPAFHRERIAGYARAMDGGRRGVGHALAGPRAARTVDVADEMGALALAIVGETLFGQDVTREADAVAAGRSTWRCSRRRRRSRRSGGGRCTCRSRRHGGSGRRAATSTGVIYG
jgi:cytochrome P450